MQGTHGPGACHWKGKWEKALCQPYSPGASEYSLRFQVRWAMKVQNAWAVQSLFCWSQIDQSKYIYNIWLYNIWLYIIYISSSLINCWNISRDSPCTRTTRGLRFAEVPEVLAIQPAVMPRQDRCMSAASLEKLDKSWVEQSLNTDWTNMNELRYERNIVNQFPCKFFAGNKHKRSNRSHVDARRTMPNIHRLTPRVPRVIMAPYGSYGSTMLPGVICCDNWLFTVWISFWEPAKRWMAPGSRGW